jgi:hypothetical protein
MILVIGLFLIIPGVAMNDSDIQYLRGLNEGYHLGYLALTGQSNETAKLDYDVHIREINNWMDLVGYVGQRWGELPIISQGYELPPIFK